MSQMCPNCSHDNPDEAQVCSNCPTPLRGLLGYRTVLSNRYQVVSVLGCGSMGAVYLAEDQRLVRRRCAIKENRPDPNLSVEVQAQSREQFLAEGSVLAMLDHPNLPKVSDYFIENGLEYLVMDYVEGEDLQSLLQRSGQPLAEEPVLNWARQVLDALEYLHSQRPQPIIHRDIKPANIVDLHGRVKLVDFGLVKLLDPDKPATKVELRGVGTPTYAPLEQFAESDIHTDARSDIYALGTTLYHLLTNLPPPDVHKRLLNPEALVPPRQLVPQLSENSERVVLKAMEIYPNQRYQSAEEMHGALSGRGRDTTPILPGATPTATRSSPIISPWVFGLLGLALVLLILAGVFFRLFGSPWRTDGISQQATVIEEQPVATATALTVQTFSDAPTPTPTPTPTATPIVQATVLGESIPAADKATPTPTATATSTPEPTATTASGSRPVVRGIPESSLVGTIAYPVFNGTDYDIYFGRADGSATRLYRSGASQPAFSSDGSRIAFRSWSSNARALITMDISGTNLRVAANFAEDQLPTWSPDGQEIVLLSRRAGDRKSRLVKVGSDQDKVDGQVIGEGEYPTIGSSGQLVFKGWGNTGIGLRLASTSLDNLQNLTDREEDTAPALAPDDQKIVFMSRRDGDWEIYIINADGSGLQRLTDDPARDGLPTWSPDGKVLAFVSDRGESWAVWAMTPTGSDQRQLFKMEGSPDGFVDVDINVSRGWAEERISWTKSEY